jgi:hypothetical protein
MFFPTMRASGLFSVRPDTTAATKAAAPPATTAESLATEADEQSESFFSEMQQPNVPPADQHEEEEHVQAALSLLESPRSRPASVPLPLSSVATADDPRPHRRDEAQLQQHGQPAAARAEAADVTLLSVLPAHRADARRQRVEAAHDARATRTADFIAGVQQAAAAIPPNAITDESLRNRLPPEEHPPPKKKRKGSAKAKGQFVWLHETLPEASGAAQQLPLLCVVTEKHLPFGNKWRGADGTAPPTQLFPDRKNESFVDLEPVVAGQAAPSLQLTRRLHLHVDPFDQELPRVWRACEGTPLRSAVERAVRRVLRTKATRKGCGRAAVWAAAEWGAAPQPLPPALALDSDAEG